MALHALDSTTHQAWGTVRGWRSQRRNDRVLDPRPETDG